MERVGPIRGADSERTDGLKWAALPLLSFKVKGVNWAAKFSHLVTLADHRSVTRMT